MTDIEIAKNVKLEKITEIAKKIDMKMTLKVMENIKQKFLMIYILNWPKKKMEN